jgi:hypothetical protein
MIVVISRLLPVMPFTEFDVYLTLPDFPALQSGNPGIW